MKLVFQIAAGVVLGGIILWLLSLALLVGVVGGVPSIVAPRIADRPSLPVQPSIATQNENAKEIPKGQIGSPQKPMHTEMMHIGAERPEPP